MIFGSILSSDYCDNATSGRIVRYVSLTRSAAFSLFRRQTSFPASDWFICYKKKTPTHDYGVGDLAHSVGLDRVGNPTNATITPTSQRKFRTNLLEAIKGNATRRTTTVIKPRRQPHPRKFTSKKNKKQKTVTTSTILAVLR